MPAPPPALQGAFAEGVEIAPILAMLCTVSAFLNKREGTF